MERTRTLRKQLLLLIGDIFIMYVSLYGALFLRHFTPPSKEILMTHVKPFSIIFFLWLLVLFINGLYELTKTRNSLKFIKTFFEALVFCALIAMGFFYFFPFYGIEPRTILLLSVTLFGILFLAWRGLVQFIITTKTLRRRVLFIGAQGEAYELIDAINTSPQFGYEVTSILDLDGNPPSDPNEKIDWLTNLSDLKPYLKRENISTIVVSPNPQHADAIARELFETIFWYIEITDLVTFYEGILGRIPVTALSETWFLENLQESQKKHYDTIKALMDYIIASSVGLICLAIYPFIAIAVYFEDKGPVFYSQRRLGKNGKEFTMYKFRTMGDDAEREGIKFAEAGDPRITRVGRVLRKTRLDELPQVWNILKGDMTFIGPRPERPEFVEHFSEVIPFYTVRHLVKPGITGWAQISYPYYATIGENMKKLQYDLFYIKNRSLFLDARIMLKTINTIMRWMGI